MSSGPQEIIDLADSDSDSDSQEAVPIVVQELPSNTGRSSSNGHNDLSDSHLTASTSSRMRPRGRGSGDRPSQSAASHALAAAMFGRSADGMTGFASDDSNSDEYRDSDDDDEYDDAIGFYFDDDDSEEDSDDDDYNDTAGVIASRGMLASRVLAQEAAQTAREEAWQGIMQVLKDKVLPRRKHVPGLDVVEQEADAIKTPPSSMVRRVQKAMSKSTTGSVPGNSNHKDAPVSLPIEAVSADFVRFEHTPQKGRSHLGSVTHCTTLLFQGTGVQALFDKISTCFYHHDLPKLKETLESLPDGVFNTSHKSTDVLTVTSRYVERRTSTTPRRLFLVADQSFSRGASKRKLRTFGIIAPAADPASIPEAVRETRANVLESHLSKAYRYGSRYDKTCGRAVIRICGNHLTNVYFYNLSVAELDEAKQHCRAINMTGNLVEDERLVFVQNTSSATTSNGSGRKASRRGGGARGGAPPSLSPQQTSFMVESPLLKDLARLQDCGGGTGPVLGPDCDGILNYNNITKDEEAAISSKKHGQDLSDNINSLLDDIAFPDPSAVVSVDALAAPTSTSSSTSSLPQPHRSNLSPPAESTNFRQRQREIELLLEGYLAPGISLKRYQLEGVAWMEMRERDPADMRFPKLHPNWKQWTMPSGDELLYTKQCGFHFRCSTQFPLAPAAPGTCGGFLCDEMGLGKTIQTLALAAVNQPPQDWLDSPLFQRGEAKAINGRDITWSPVAIRSTLIVAPMTLIDQWTSEIEKFFQPGTLTYAIYRPKKGMHAFAAEGPAQPVKETPVAEKGSLDTGTQKAGPRRGRRQRRSVQKFTFPDPETEPRKSSTKSAPLATEKYFARVIAISEGNMLADPSGNFISADKLRKPEDFPQVIFCSYATLRAELRGSNAFDPSTMHGDAQTLPGSTGRCRLPIHMPLKQLGFWRVCLDEAQMVNNTNSAAAIAASELWRRYAWVCTGTPLSRCFDEIHGLLEFLDHRPFGNKHMFHSLVAKNPLARASLLKHVMLRRNKKQAYIARQLDLPRLRRVQRRAPFAETERVSYQQLQNTLAKSYEAAKKDRERRTEDGPQANKWGGPREARVPRQVAARPTQASIVRKRQRLAKLAADLTRLRQACCHPSLAKDFLASATRRKVASNPRAGAQALSMTEITHVLLTRAHAKYELALRKELRCKLNCEVASLMHSLPLVPPAFLALTGTNCGRLLRQHVSTDSEQVNLFSDDSVCTQPAPEFLLPANVIDFSQNVPPLVETTEKKLVELHSTMLKRHDEVRNVRARLQGMLKEDDRGGETLNAHDNIEATNANKAWARTLSHAQATIVFLSKLRLAFDSTTPGQDKHSAAECVDALCTTYDIGTLYHQHRQRHDTRKRKTQASAVNARTPHKNLAPAARFSFYALKLERARAAAGVPPDVLLYGRADQPPQKKIVRADCDAASAEPSSDDVKVTGIKVHPESSSETGSVSVVARSTPQASFVPWQAAAVSRLATVVAKMDDFMDEEGRQYVRGAIKQFLKQPEMPISSFVRDVDKAVASSASTKREFEVSQSRMQAHLDQQGEAADGGKASSTSGDTGVADETAEDDTEPDDAANACPICMEAFGGESGVEDWVVTTCSHSFCRDCVQWHLARQGGHAPCPICRKIISKKDLFQVSNKKIDTSATNDAEQAQKTPNNEGTRGELDDENVLDLLTEQLDRPEDDTDKAERVVVEENEQLLTRQLEASGTRKSILEKFGSKMYSLLFEVMLSARLEAAGVISSRKIVVFSAWVAVLSLCASMLNQNGIPSAVFRGSETCKTTLLRQFRRPLAAHLRSSRATFVSESEPLQVLLIPLSTGLGAAGLNLTNAATVLFVEPPLSESTEAQALARIYRIGQMSPSVRSVTLLVADSIEERVLLIRRKERAAALKKVQGEVSQDVDDEGQPEERFGGMTESDIESLIIHHSVRE